MASDHRGRGVHAGKRTNQEMAKAADAYARQSGWKPTPGGVTIYTKGRSPWNAAGMVVHHYFDEDLNNSIWQVNTKGESQPVTRTDFLMNTQKDLGRGKKASGYEGSNALIVSGTTKTPRRAMIAAEAMKKRLDEGRDLKTGRPKDAAPVKKSAPVYEYGPGERAVEKRLSDSLFGRSKK